MKLKKKFSKLIRGYFLFLKSIFFKIDYDELTLPFKISTAIIILTLVGMTRVIVSILILQGCPPFVWSFSLGLAFCLLISPNFLCFFPAMIIDYASKRWGWGIKPKNILGFLFFAQCLYVIVLLLDLLADMSNISKYLPLAIPNELYFKLALSPLALTPLILLVTKVGSFGITMVWFALSITVIKYGIHNKVSMIKFLAVFMIIFYIIYVLAYPASLLLFVYVQNNVPESAFYYTIPFLVGAIGGILYFESKNNKTHE